VRVAGVGYAFRQLLFFQGSLGEVDVA